MLFALLRLKHTTILQECRIFTTVHIFAAFLHCHWRCNPPPNRTNDSQSMRWVSFIQTDSVFGEWTETPNNTKNNALEQSTKRGKVLFKIANWTPTKHASDSNRKKVCCFGCALCISNWWKISQTCFAHVIPKRSKCAYTIHSHTLHRVIVGKLLWTVC